MIGSQLKFTERVLRLRVSVKVELVLEILNTIIIH